MAIANCYNKKGQDGLPSCPYALPPLPALFAFPMVGGAALWNSTGLLPGSHKDYYIFNYQIIF